MFNAKFKSKRLNDLIELRDEAHLSQDDVGEYFGLKGKKRRDSIRAWEYGYSRPEPEYARRPVFLIYLCDILGLRNDPQRFQKIWQEVMVDTWKWEPLSEAEWKKCFPGHLTSDADKNRLATKPITTLTFPSFFVPRQCQEDWGEAPDTSIFYGRQMELEELERWLVVNHCRLIGIFGLGGMGKTTLATKLADQVKVEFDYIMWRSLRNAPPLGDILSEWLQFLSDQLENDVSNEISRKISHLIDYLRKHRCLLVLDNVEAILRQGEQAGHYQPGYEDYGELLRRIGETGHQSCVILTSREKPKEFALLEGEISPVRSFQLAGLEHAAGQALLQDKRLFGAEEIWTNLIDRYSGNPLALKLISETIREVFDGHITDFLKKEAAIFGGIEDVLAQQFERLSELEQELMFWLAIEREPILLKDLEEILARFTPESKLLEGLRSLRRRSLVEKSSAGFTLQNVVMEYVTGRLADQIHQEITTQSLSMLQGHALIKAQTKDYLRESQIRLILKPIADRLLSNLGQRGVEDKCRNILALLRDNQLPGYAAGNILNLLVQLKSDLSRFDFSQQVIWQAYLPGVKLHAVNFSGATFAKSVFTETFGGILSLTFSPDGQLLAAGTTKGEVRLWQAATGQPFLICEGHTNYVQSVAFSPDSSMLASGSSDHTVRLWEVNTGRCLKILAGNTNRIRAVAFSPDGRLLASGGADRVIRLWDVGTGQNRQILSGHKSGILALAFSSDGHFLASSSKDQVIRVWEISTGQCRYELTGHTDWIWSVAFSPDSSSLVSGSDDQTVRLWDTSTGQCLDVLHGHIDRVKTVAFSPDGRYVASGGNDQSVRLWDVNTGETFQLWRGHTGWVWALAFSPDSQMLVSGSYNQTVRLWEVSTGRCLHEWQGHTNRLGPLAFNPDGTLLASGGDNQTARIWELDAGQSRYLLPETADTISALTFSPNGRLLATNSHKQTIRLRDVQSGQIQQTLTGHADWVRALAFSPEGSILVSGSEDQTVRLWDVSDGHCLQIWSGHTGRVRTVAFSSSGNVIASGGDDQTVRLWQVNLEDELDVFQGHTGWIWAMAFNPQGRLLASGSADQTVRLWDVETRQCLRILTEHSGHVVSVAFSPRGDLLASGSEDQKVRIWDAHTGQLLQTLQGHSEGIKSVAFNPIGNFLASASDDGTIRFWEIQTGDCIKVLRSDRPYERMNITGVIGLTEAQKAALKMLGAVEGEREE